VIPEKIHARLAYARETQTLRRVLAWLESDEEALVLQGGTGSSKTYAAAWAHQWQDHRAPIDGMGRRRTCVWWDARALSALAPWAGEVRGPRRDESPTGWAAYDLASVVVIDDVGTEDDHARMTGRLLITTNLAPATFAQLYGERVASRLKGSGKWCLTTDPDFRASPPTGAPWPKPTDLTDRERRQQVAEDAQRDADLAEWAATAHIRELLAASALAEVESILGAKRDEHTAPNTDDEQRRAELRRQVAELGDT
jgi:hypothetical protein